VYCSLLGSDKSSVGSDHHAVTLAVALVGVIQGCVVGFALGI
jgi:hypothetical protein